jgi:long-chain-fatty-acid---luciferin-component ligase
VIAEELPPVSMIDSVVFGDQEWLEQPEEWQRELRLSLVREAFVRHLDSCGGYAAFAERQSVDADRIQSFDDLVRIPQFPTSVFKRQRLLSVPLDNIVRSFTSSGTSGTKSVIYRDGVTLHRLCGMMQSDSPLFGDYFDGVDESNSVIVNLGTSRDDSGHVWFGYVMSLLEQVAPMWNYVAGSHVRLAEAVADTRRSLVEKERVFVVGPPFLVADFCQEMATSGRRIDGADALFVFTGGGWKNRESERIDRAEFNDMVRATLGLADRAQIRDVFNQVELNTLLVECERHRKHVPPWVHAFTRDPVTFSPTPDGQVGVLCFSDATAHSYPCFIVGDDLGRVRSGTCDCGRHGVTVEVLRRLRGTTHAGCADDMRSKVKPIGGSAG